MNRAGLLVELEATRAGLFAAMSGNDDFVALGALVVAIDEVIARVRAEGAPPGDEVAAGALRLVLAARGAARC